MISYLGEIWVGFLCKQVIRQSVQLANMRCPGCKSKLKSPVLNLFQQHFLLLMFKTEDISFLLLLVRLCTMADK